MVENIQIELKTSSPSLQYLKDVISSQSLNFSLLKLQFTDQFKPFWSNFCWIRLEIAHVDPLIRIDRCFWKLFSNTISPGCYERELKCDVLYNLLEYTSHWKAALKFSNSYVSISSQQFLMLFPVTGQYVYLCFAVPVQDWIKEFFSLKPLTLMVTILS